MTSAVIEHIEPEEKQGFLSKLFNKITAPVRDWLNDITDQYEDAKIRVETGVTPNREFSSAELDEQRFKHIVSSLYSDVCHNLMLSKVVQKVYAPLLSNSIKTMAAALMLKRSQDTQKQSPK